MARATAWWMSIILLVVSVLLMGSLLGHRAAQVHAVETIGAELAENRAVIEEIRMYGVLGRNTNDVLALTEVALPIADLIDKAYRMADDNNDLEKGRDKFIQQLMIRDSRLAAIVLSFDVGSHGLKWLHENSQHLAQLESVAAASDRFLETQDSTTLRKFLEEYEHNIVYISEVNDKLTDVEENLRLLNSSLDGTISLLQNASHNTNLPYEQFLFSGLAWILSIGRDQSEGLYRFALDHQQSFARIHAFLEELRESTSSYRLLNDLVGWFPGEQHLIDSEERLAFSIIGLGSLAFCAMIATLLQTPFKQKRRTVRTLRR